MRADMLKVLMDVRKRPRQGPKPHEKTGKRIRPAQYEDDDPGLDRPSVSDDRYSRRHVPMRFAPIRKFIASCVGMLWDDVYSEMAEVVDIRSAAGREFFRNVDYVVDTHAYIHDGAVYHGTYAYDFYVEPITGLLKKSEAGRHHRFGKYADPEAWKRKVLGPFTEVQWIDGIWYLETYHMVPHWYYRWDSEKKENIRVRGKDIRSLLKKKQLSRTELRRYGVRNTPTVRPVRRRKLRRVA